MVWCEQSACVLCLGYVLGSCLLSMCALCLDRVVCTMYALAALVLVKIDVMVMSTAYEVTCTGACGCSMLDVYRLNWLVVVVWFLNVM